MAGPGKAKAGQSSTGDQDLEEAGDIPASEAGGSAVPDRGLVSEPQGSASVFGREQAEVEAQLRAFYGQLAAQQPPRFPPLEELAARLKEFGLTKEGLGPAPAGDAQDIRSSGGPAAPISRRSPSEWLAALPDLRQERSNEIAAINTRLSEIVDRLDNLSARMPDASIIAAVDMRMTSLTRSLDEVRAQSAVNSDRISRAAKEILAASSQVREDRIGFEAVARHTIEDLGQTIVATASRAAVLTAGEMAISQRRQPEPDGMERLEQELRALKAESRQRSEHTAASLDQANDMLRNFLERTKQTAGPPRKRPTLDMPISADSSVYSLTGKGFGSESPAKPLLASITLRAHMQPSDPNLITALQEAEERLNKNRVNRAVQPENGLEGGKPPFLKATRVLEEEKSHPLAGIAIVAIILLLASAALYFLQTRTQLVPFHLSLTPERAAAPQKAADPSPPALETPPPAAPADKTGGSGDLRKSENTLPALFTAASQTAQASGADEDPAEDLKILEAAARNGDREAQFRIGKRFLSDSELDGGPATAARWLARAADQGHLEAIFMLASLYEQGAGVSKDLDHAIELYREASSAGHVRAMHNLGVLLSARGSGPSYREAASWFNRAALAGLADSQYNLALLYERGLGVEQDLTRAYFWYRVAAHSGDKEAVQQAERLKRTMPLEETTAAGEQAGSWRPSLEEHPKSAGESRGSPG